MQMVTTLVIGDSFESATVSFSVIDANGIRRELNTATVNVTDWTHVGISASATAFTLQEFTFAVIPEPSAFVVLAGAGVLALAVMRRRRRA